MSEVRRLEETANKNEEELSVILTEDRGAGGGGIRGELDQLKHRLGKLILTMTQLSSDANIIE